MFKDDWLAVLLRWNVRLDSRRIELRLNIPEL